METSGPTAEDEGAELHGYRASLVDYCGDPSDGHTPRYVDDGLLVVAAGRVVAAGDFSSLRPRYKELQVRDYRGKLIMPGFIDAHVHYPQLPMIASHGEQLLQWLEGYAFPAERKLADVGYAGDLARDFVAELLRNGTTSAVVLCSVHAASVDALAEQALAHGMRLVLGKVCMDRHVPADMCDSADSTYEDNAALIARYHRRGRLHYALTPRFAASCSEGQMRALAQLHRDYPDTYVHSHLAENRAEIAWIRRLFPQRASYTDVYAHYGLVGPRSIFAHGVHLDDGELSCLATAQATIAFCPSSNLFLGSGLFPFRRVRRAGVKVALASDVGAGTSLNMMQNLCDAYKIMQLGGDSLGVHEALYAITLGAARCLGLDDLIGNFEPGKEADFVVLDSASTPLLRLRCASGSSLEDRLFALLVLADDRAIAATYVAGQLRHQIQPQVQP